jgi:hypothetical protein
MKTTLCKNAHFLGKISLCQFLRKSKKVGLKKALFFNSSRGMSVMGVKNPFEIFFQGKTQTVDN